jgi:hypothetical protein
MKGTKILLLLILVNCVSYGQKTKKSPRVIKIGTTDYDTGTDFAGKAVYHYYIDPISSEEVMEGSYKASGYSKSDVGFSSFSITGQFKDGYCDGVWVYKKERKDVQLEGGSYSTGQLRCTKRYKNGLPNGKWTMHENWKMRDRLNFYGKPIWGHFDDPVVDSALATFKDGVQVGSSFCKKFNSATMFSYNNKGFVVGKYADSWGRQMTFNSNGVRTHFWETPTDTMLLRVANGYVEGKIPKTELDKMSIKVDTIKNASEYMPSLFEQPFLTEEPNIVYGRYLKFEIKKD